MPVIMQTHNANVAVSSAVPNSNLNIVYASTSSRSCTPPYVGNLSSSSSSKQFYQPLQHTTSLAYNNNNKNDNANYNKTTINKFNYDKSISIDILSSLGNSMPSLSLQPHSTTSHGKTVKPKSHLNLIISNKYNAQNNKTQEHNIDVSSNSSLNTVPSLELHAINNNGMSAVNNFMLPLTLSKEPLMQLKRKWTKLQRQRHRRSNSNGSSGDAKELDKLVLQSVAWDDSDIY